MSAPEFSPWPGTLTARERFLRQMRREPVDRCFNREFGFWEENFTTWPMFRDRGISTNAQADVQLCFDRMETVDAPWMDPPFPEEEVRRTGTTRILRISHGLLAEVPLDGHSTIPHYLEGGVNIMFPWEVNGSGHPGAALDRWGPELRIMGGVDKMALRQGPEAIRNYLGSLIPWVRQGGFIPFCDHRCPPDVAQQDYLYYLDLKRDLFCVEIDPARSL